ncbi:DUF6313 family protein [Streptomyces bathyalis]|uniref:DUF6313 family protein n=1 Tax=Streptomyces bathyalis TaxID=2710756 RepID=UPI003CCDBC73
MVTWASRRHALGRLPHWLLTRAAVVLAICAGVFVANGALVGWGTAYELMTGITSPAEVQPSWLAWALSLLGWGAIPAVVGGTAGYVITVQIERHQSRDFEAVIGELRALIHTDGDAGDEP